MKVIITGATGCLGRNLVENLHGEGYSVVATGRSPDVGAEIQVRGVEFRAADIRDVDQLAAVFEPADCVVHCAGKSGGWGAYAEFHEANVLGTRNVVHVCQRHGIEKILFVSTPSVYFNGKDRLGVRESDPLPGRPATHYARSKLLAEAELLAFQRSGGKVINFRPRAVVGPHDTTFVPRLLRMAQKRRLPLVNGGRALTDITHVDNFVDAVKLALAAPESAWNATYNVSNGEPIRVRDWFARMLEILGRPFRPVSIPEPVARVVAAATELAGNLPFGPRQPLITRFSVGYMARSMTLSIDRAREQLGYTPRLGNEEGFERYAAWLRLHAPRSRAQVR